MIGCWFGLSFCMFFSGLARTIRRVIRSSNTARPNLWINPYILTLNPPTPDISHLEFQNYNDPNRIAPLPKQWPETNTKNALNGRRTCAHGCASQGSVQGSVSQGLFPRGLFPTGSASKGSVSQVSVCQAVSQGVRFPESRIGLRSPSGWVGVRRDVHARIHGVAPAKRYLPRDKN